MIGIIGAIVGDIVGSTFEFINAKNIPYDFPLITEHSQITDDSVCTIAVADWLLHTDRTHEELVHLLKYWGLKYKVGFGPMFWNWLSGQSTEPYNSLGNGSAMRVSPVGWVANTLEECDKLATISAEVTHNHPRGIDGAKVTASAIFLTRMGYDKNYVKNYIESTYPDYRILMYNDLVKSHMFDCTCPTSVCASLSAWYYSNSYEDCVRKAVVMNGDTDTEACVAGSICNADKNTQIDDNMLLNILEHTNVIDNDIIDIVNEFHETYEQ